MIDEKVYQFNDYILGYDKGLNDDRSCLTISKIKNENMYVISSLYDESANLISNMLDFLKERIAYLERSNNRREENITSLQDECIELEEENERLKEKLNRYNKYTCLRSKIMLDDYKSRVEKTNEYIEEHITADSNVDGDMWYTLCNNTSLDDFIINIRNFLQGGKDE